MYPGRSKDDSIKGTMQASLSVGGVFGLKIAGINRVVVISDRAFVYTVWVLTPLVSAQPSRYPINQLSPEYPIQGHTINLEQLGPKQTKKKFNFLVDSTLGQ